LEVHTKVEREVRGELKKLRREIEEVCGITNEMGKVILKRII